uniref:FHA domain-containing protein n=1 Tax=Aureoumbra lagunensis TaxID=44058 RepID=A0A7S3NIR3_9STRA|mmetsp:Transcript_8746/g.12143  ORF Transcript_8746/g.12143 Transcript_8746/m.12143 type:complete len:450 (+) Transcript_8746:41-1390(+)
MESFLPQVPSWSARNASDDEDLTHWRIETIRQGVSLGKQRIRESRWVIGRNGDSVDLELQHPSISRIHAILQKSCEGRLYVYDCSTHGTKLNKTVCPREKYIELRDGDVLAFGASTRLFSIHHSTAAGNNKTKEGPRPVRQDGLSVMNIKKEDNNSCSEDAPALLEDDEERSTKKNPQDAKMIEKLEAKHAKATRLRTELERLRSKDELSEVQVEVLRRTELAFAKIQDQIADMEALLKERQSSRNSSKRPFVSQLDHEEEDSTMRDLTQKLKPPRTESERQQRRRMRFTVTNRELPKERFPDTHAASFDELVVMRAQLDKSNTEELAHLDRLILLSKPALPGLSQHDTSANMLNDDTNSDNEKRRPRSEQDASSTNVALNPSMANSKPITNSSSSSSDREKEKNEEPQTTSPKEAYVQHQLEGGDTIWHPPANQDGSGRTELNDLLGY